MTISLWVLVDNSGRILYTGFSQEFVEHRLANHSDCQVIELKGVMK
jgi:hypothetical protein